MSDHWSIAIRQFAMTTFLLGFFGGIAGGTILATGQFGLDTNPARIQTWTWAEVAGLAACTGAACTVVMGLMGMRMHGARWHWWPFAMYAAGLCVGMSRFGAAPAWFLLGALLALAGIIAFGRGGDLKAPHADDDWA